MTARAAGYAADEMKVASLLAIVALLAPPSWARGQTPADSAGIRQAALDYIEGWWAGDAARMGRALHPELVKRILVRDPESDREWIDTMGATRLVAGTRAGYGREVPAAERRQEVRILDIFGNAAVARIDAGPWVDYLELVKAEGRWVILNVLWERHP
jgi:hypothetical protein